MIKLIQFMQGYVSIKVSGYSPERFMNLCCNHNILLWDIKNHGDFYTMSISISGYFKLKSIVKKTRTKVAIEKKCGLPFFIPKIRRRSIFGFGLLSCFIFLCVMSQFIWTIELIGNESITEDVFFDFLATQGIHYGMSKREIGMESLERQIRETYTNVTWTSGRIDGTRLTIKIKENAYATPLPEDVVSEGFDIIADKSGIIVSMITRQGVPQVHIGDTVNQGDIMVSGKIPILADDLTVREYKLCHADADIYMQTVEMYSEKLPEKYLQKKYTGLEKKIPFIQVLDKEIPLGSTNTKMIRQDNTIEKKQMKISENFYLPFYYGTIQAKEYMLTEKKYDIEEAKVILGKRFLENIKTLEEKGVQILEKDVKIEHSSNEYILKASLTLVEEIGQQVQSPQEQLEVKETDE